MQEIVWLGFKGTRRSSISAQDICGAHNSLGTLWCWKRIRKIPHKFAHGTSSEKFICMITARPGSRWMRGERTGSFKLGSSKEMAPAPKDRRGAFCKPPSGGSPSGQSLSKQGFSLGEEKVLLLDLKGKEMEKVERAIQLHLYSHGITEWKSIGEIGLQIWNCIWTTLYTVPLVNYQLQYIYMYARIHICNTNHSLPFV